GAGWGQLAAEDVHVGNLVEMGNIAGTYFKQPAWDRAGQFDRDGYAIVPGQEDPRTGMRGHTIHWNLKSHVHFEQEAFFQYDREFERTRSQGALTGYAHLGELFNGRRGLALDVPFGLVDFIEVLQGGRLNTDVWYSFLNLGYKVLPVGGADYPYFGPTLPGVERTYVRLDAPFSAAAWFDGFRRGHVYVTNGPFVRLSVNGREIGEEVRVARGPRLDIRADYQRAQLNELLTVPIDPNSDLEAWETGETLVDQWPQQLPLLRPRIEEADRRYRQLLERFRGTASQR